MGIFSGKKKTYRDFSLARLIEDDYLPDIIGQAVTTYVLSETNTKSLTDLMLEYGWSAVDRKWNSAYRWAAKEPNYYYGVPKATVVAESDFTGAASLQEVLQSITGQSALDYTYSKFVPGNFRHAMWQLLVSNHNYTATTNILGRQTAEVGSTCWLYNATNYIDPTTKENGNDVLFEHWGYSPTSGVTNDRSQDLNREDTPDLISGTGDNYVRVEYASSLAGVTKTTTKTTTKVTTVVKTPNDEGGYDEETSSTSGDTTNTDYDYGSFNIPEDTISKTEVVTSNNDSTETDPPDVVTSTDPVTGVITEVTTEVTRDINIKVLSLNIIAYFNMDFGIYNFNPDMSDVDTTTELNTDDEGNYDPNAPLKPSGEDEQGSDDYFMVCYTYSVGSTLHIGYFTYMYGSGSYPSLDGITGTVVEDFGKHMPRMYFRADGNNLLEDSRSETEPYITSKKFGRKLEMPWLEVGEEIYNSIGSMDKVRDLYIEMLVPANTETHVEQKYLVNYFKTMYNLRPAVPKTWTDPDNDFEQFAVHEGAYVISSDIETSSNIACSYIGYALINGNIGSATASGRGVGKKPTVIPSSGAESSMDINYHYYQQQVTDTQYEEVRVYDLSSAIRVGGTDINRSGDSEELMIPLDYAFRQKFTPHERETLYARAMNIVIGTEYTVKTKWYQTGVFKAVTIVVAVVVSWWTGGASLSLIGAVTAVATAVGTYVIFSLLSKFVFSKLGGVFAIVAMVAAIAVAIYSGYIYVSGATGPFNLTALDLIQVSNYAFKASNSAIQGELTVQQQRMNNLQTEIENKTNELEAAQKELAGRTTSIDNNTFLNSISGFGYVGDTPESYYGRSLDTNIGVIALDLPTLFLSQTLSLESSVSIFARMQQNIDKPSELDDMINAL